MSYEFDKTRVLLSPPVRMFLRLNQYKDHHVHVCYSNASVYTLVHVCYSNASVYILVHVCYSNTSVYTSVHVCYSSTIVYIYYRYVYSLVQG